VKRRLHVTKLRGAEKSTVPGPTVEVPLSKGGEWRVIKPGGRSSVSGIVATVFGCSGFVGRYAVNALGSIGSQCIVPYRGDGMNVRHLKLMGDLGQIVPVPFDIADEESVARAVSRSNVVVNLIGARFETMNYSFHDVNVKVAWRIAKIAKQCGVERFVHMSCLGADANSPSVGMRTKYEGEVVVKSLFPEATILRPAPIFGHEDSFLNRLAAIINMSPFFPNFGDHLSQQLQPIYVLDVAQAVLNAIMSTQAQGQTYELGGPEVFSVEEIVKMIRREIYHDGRPILWLPEIVGKAFASVMELSPRTNWRLFTQNDLFQAKTPQVVGETAQGLTALNITPTPISNIAGAVLLRHRGNRGPDVQGRSRKMAEPA